MDKLDDLLFGAHEPPNSAHSFGVLFSGGDIDLNGGDTALSPPIEAVDQLHNAFFGVPDGSGMGLLALDEIEFPALGVSYISSEMDSNREII